MISFLKLTPEVAERIHMEHFGDAIFLDNRNSDDYVFSRTDVRKPEPFMLRYSKLCHKERLIRWSGNLECLRHRKEQGVLNLKGLLAGHRYRVVCHCTSEWTDPKCPVHGCSCATAARTCPQHMD